MSLHNKTSHTLTLVPVLLCLFLFACTPQKPITDNSQLAEAFNPSSFVPGNIYNIDSSQSELLIYIFRDGPLARFGHNHIISHHNISGKLYAGKTLKSSGIQLTLPVTGFVVDKPELRQLAGGEFNSTPSEKDIRGTKKNMLSPTVLDADQFPDIKLTSVHINAEKNSTTATMRVLLKGRYQDFSLPITIKKTGEALTINGKIRLAQTRLGLTPFRILMGAIAVRDEMDIHFRLFAKPEQSYSMVPRSSSRLLSTRDTKLISYFPQVPEGQRLR